MNPKTSTPSLSEDAAVWQELQQRNERLAVMAVLVAVRKKRLRKVWYNMRIRCYYPKAADFQWYGARGITICAEWRNNFEVFAQWALSHGFYTDLVIDRRESNGNYNPTNCRWATLSLSSKNKRVTPKFIEARRRVWPAIAAKMLAAHVAANSRPVIASNGIAYPSTAAASRAIGRDVTAVWQCLQGRRKTTGGLTWKYATSQ